MQIDTGFSNWKDGVAKICKHKQSDHHIEAHSVLYVLPTRSKEIDQRLDIGHASKTWQQADFADHLVECEISG